MARFDAKLSFQSFKKKKKKKAQIEANSTFDNIKIS
jgi:hypothetical protein